MIELAVLACAAVAVFAVGMLVLAALKVALWIILLPLRLLVGIILLPLLVLKALFGGILLLVAGPVLVIAAVAALVALAAALVVPLLPVLLVIFVVWLVLRSRQVPAATQLSSR